MSSSGGYVLAYHIMPNWPSWACGRYEDQLGLKIHGSVLHPSLALGTRSLIWETLTGSPLGLATIPDVGDRAVNHTFPRALGRWARGWLLSGQVQSLVGAQHRGAKPSPKLGIMRKSSQRKRFKLRPATRVGGGVNQAGRSKEQHSRQRD